MQAVILAAGVGSRMRPLSTVTPKPMLPVLDRPLVAHVADAALAGGADELVVVVGPQADHVQGYFGDRYGDVPVTYATQEVAKGTADAVRAAGPYLEDRFAVLNGDTLFDPESVLALFQEDAAVATHRVEDPGSYGVLSTDGDRVTGIVEKPDDPPGDLVNAGAYVFPAWVRDALDVPPSERGERELTDVLATVVDRENVRAVRTTRWLDVARPADLLAANALAIRDRPSTVAGSLVDSAHVRGSVHVGDGAIVGADARLEGPVFVGRDASVERGVELVGPVVVGAGATVDAEARLERCVLFPGASVGDGVRLRNVVLGPRCSLMSDATIAGVQDENGHGTAAVIAAGEAVEGGLVY